MKETLVVTATAANTAPTVASAIPDTTVNENSSAIGNYRDLNAVFTDTEDGSALAFTIASNSNATLVTATIDADSTLDLSIAASTTGSATLVIRATDAGALFVEDTLVLTVLSTAISISSVAHQTLTVNDASTAADTITITDDAVTATITAVPGGGDIRIVIPTGVNMLWDATIGTVTIGGGASAKVSTTVLGYANGDKTVVLNVTTDFAAGEQITVSGLKFISFTAASSADNLDVVVGGSGGAVVATDDKTIAVGVPRPSAAATQTRSQAAPGRPPPTPAGDGHSTRARGEPAAAGSRPSGARRPRRTARAGPGCTCGPPRPPSRRSTCRRSSSPAARTSSPRRR